MKTRSETTKPTPPETVAKRLELTFRFMREVIADPARLDDIPSSGAVVVVLPADDPEFAAQEREYAERLRGEGRQVFLEEVGVEPITEAGWERLNAPIPAWSPTWATDLDFDRATIVYDQQRDALLVDVSRGTRHGWAWPLNELIYLLLDAETEEAFAFLIPELLSKATQRLPELTRVLRLAEMRPLSEAERGQLAILEHASANGVGGSHSDLAATETWQRFLTGIRLITRL